MQATQENARATAKGAFSDVLRLWSSLLHLERAATAKDPLLQKLQQLGQDLQEVQKLFHAAPRKLPDLFYSDPAAAAELAFAYIFCGGSDYDHSVMCYLPEIMYLLSCTEHSLNEKHEKMLSTFCGDYLFRRQTDPGITTETICHHISSAYHSQSRKGIIIGWLEILCRILEAKDEDPGAYEQIELKPLDQWCQKSYFLIFSQDPEIRKRMQKVVVLGGDGTEQALLMAFEEHPGNCHAELVDCALELLRRAHHLWKVGNKATAKLLPASKDRFDKLDLALSPIILKFWTLKSTDVQVRIVSTLDILGSSFAPQMVEEMLQTLPPMLAHSDSDGFKVLAAISKPQSPYEGFSSESRVQLGKKTQSWLAVRSEFEPLTDTLLEVAGRDAPVLEDPSRERALRILAQLGLSPTKVYPLLLRYLACKDTKMRHAASDALGWYQLLYNCRAENGKRPDEITICFETRSEEK